MSAQVPSEYAATGALQRFTAPEPTSPVPSNVTAPLATPAQLAGGRSASISAPTSVSAPDSTPVVTPPHPRPPPITFPTTLPSTAPAPLASPLRPPGSSPDDAVYASAHRAHFEARDFAAALSGWDEYLAQAPAGRFAPEARYNRAICLLRLGRNDEAARALAPFADAPVGGYRQAEARSLRDAILEAGTQP